MKIQLIYLLLIIVSCGTTNEGNTRDNRDFTVQRLFDNQSSTYYYLTHICHKDRNGKIIQMKHAHSIEGSGETVREFAQRVKCRLAFNASTMQRATEGGIVPNGKQIVDGIIKRDGNTTAYTLGIRENNTLKAFKPEANVNDILNDGFNNALTAFGPLIEDFHPASEEALKVRRNYDEKHPRQVIAQFNNLDILFLSCGGRGFDGDGMTARDVIRILQTKGVRFAYMLDGGGSVSTVINGELITKKIDAKGTKERKRPDFLYFE